MQARFCSKCGSPLKEGAKFCTSCGAPVKQRAAAVPPQPDPQYVPPQPKPQYVPPQPQTQFVPPQGGGYSFNDNPEGTVLLGDINRAQNTSGRTLKKAEIGLTIEEMLSGCSKVVDFGTGKRYEISIPGGLTPGDTIVVENTGITDRDTGNICDIELTAVIG